MDQKEQPFSATVNVGHECTFALAAKKVGREELCPAIEEERS